MTSTVRKRRILMRSRFFKRVLLSHISILILRSTCIDVRCHTVQNNRTKHKRSESCSKKSLYNPKANSGLASSNFTISATFSSIQSGNMMVFFGEKNPDSNCSHPTGKCERESANQLIELICFHYLVIKLVTRSQKENRLISL